MDWAIIVNVIRTSFSSPCFPHCFYLYFSRGPNFEALYSFAPTRLCLDLMKESNQCIIEAILERLPVFEYRVWRSLTNQANSILATSWKGHYSLLWLMLLVESSYLKMFLLCWIPDMDSGCLVSDEQKLRSWIQMDTAISSPCSWTGCFLFWFICLFYGIKFLNLTLFLQVWLTEAALWVWSFYSRWK